MGEGKQQLGFLHRHPTSVAAEVPTMSASYLYAMFRTTRQLMLLLQEWAGP